VSAEAVEQPVGWVRFWSPKDDWYYLDPAERSVYLEGHDRALERAIACGARLLGVYKCRGQSRWARFEAWEFPSLDVLLDLTDDLEEIGHFQYFSEDRTFGRRYDRRGDPESWVI
jgi:hypothetical protein